MLFIGCCMLLSTVAAFDTVHEWNFGDEHAPGAWYANAHLTDITISDGALHGRAVDWDPFFTCSDIAIEATAAQCVLIRMKADKPGNGQFFWTGLTSGEHGGFSQDKMTDFSVTASAEFQDIYVFPFWHTEGVIRQLRLDMYEGVQVSIERIVVLERTSPSPPATTSSWHLADTSVSGDWISLNKGRVIAGPPLSIPLENIGWISVSLHASADAAIGVEWTTSAILGSHRETVYVKRYDGARTYHIEMYGHREWTGELVGLNLHLPDPETIRLENISVAAEPDGPPEIEVLYFGFENGVSRAGRPESLLAQFTNRGGGKADLSAITLEVADDVRIHGEPARDGNTLLTHGEIMELRWQIEGATPKTSQAILRTGSERVEATTYLMFMPLVEHRENYVPEPMPVETAVDICAYYFPGWNADAKYDCLRYTAPVRKPLLGYYDEGNPECVDWQIKWAVENGIRCFLVDWYWVAGRQSLLHWFDAYRTARYRDYLDVAIMWANHNPAGTHSREDWRNVTREWIEQYFSLPGYYQINGKPAVFLWDSHILRNDLGGSSAVAEAFAESQKMAQDAGYAGIEFIILQHHANAEHLAQWQSEGYAGNTSYHEFGRALEIAPASSQARYADVAATAHEAWEQRRELSGSFPYYPVVDTGWDSRPWHGANAMAFHGRTVTDFKELLTDARDYCTRHGQQILILGPINEWGEGSYIEPNLEFGFGMYEAIREVFGLGNPKDWPYNLSPHDVNLGPYDFPKAPQKLAWHFETDVEGWAAMMNVGPLTVAEGIMRFQTMSRDPALVVSTPGLHAAEYPRLRIRMKVVGTLAENSQGQLFWAIGNGATAEATSCRFPLHHDQQWHDYVLNLGEHPRWRGRISMLRFDPCETGNAEVYLEHVVFERE